MKQSEFKLQDAVTILERTPVSLKAMLEGLPEIWTRATEGEGTWSPYDVIGHLIHGERTDWIPRVQHILAGDPGPFLPFDRTAMLTESEGKELCELLETFADLRKENLATLKAMNLTDSDFDRRGLHPELGEVTLRQLLATRQVTAAAVSSTTSAPRFKTRTARSPRIRRRPAPMSIRDPMSSARSF